MLKVAIILTSFAIVALSVPTNLEFSPINLFSLRLLDNTYAFQENFGNKNIAISPVSIWSLFALLAEGSTSDTFEELMKELQLPNDLRATQMLHLAASRLLQSKDEDVLLKEQGAMFSDGSLELHPDFCESAMSYNTDVYSVDTKNTTKLANDINFYICEATEGRILNAVTPDLLEDLKVILVDALYFKASWTYPFDPTSTKEDVFYNSQGRMLGMVNMMYHKAPHHIGDSPQIGAQILELTYGRNEQYSMLILLPFDGMPIKMLLNNLATQNLDWMSSFRSEGNPPQIDCYIPRFKIQSQTDLIPPLQYTGIISIFDKERAQLPGISDSPLFVSKTIQNVEVEVNEEGTLAAAATVIGLEDRILGQRFEANREFVFLITERMSNLILFAGVYSDPALV